MKITIMNKDVPVMLIEFEGINAKSEWLGEPMMKVPPCVWPDRITTKGILKFCETRLPPRTRIGIEDILKKHGVPEYMPLRMCRNSHGVTMTDYLWFKFDEEDLCYADVGVKE